MDKIMNVDPGLMIWTLINFLFFLLILAKFGFKQIKNGLKAREEKISGDLSHAEQFKLDAAKLLKESQSKIDQAQREMSEIIAKGRENAEILIQKAAEEAERVKKLKVEEAVREIDRCKEIAIKQLRTEVADLVIKATEKIIDETLDKEKHYKIIESYIEQLPNN